MPVDIENARPKLPLAISTGTPLAVANDLIEVLLLVTHKTKIYQNSKKKWYIY